MGEQKRIGVIGVGLMGHGIASNLLKHGHALNFLHHVGNQPCDDLIAAGARSTETVAALAAEAEIIILCVTGSPEVEAIVFHADGLERSLKPGTIVIDCTTAMPRSTEKVAKAIVEAGGRFLDAAMTRTPNEAASGRLGLIVGADAALFREALPILRCFGEAIIHAGPVGSGHRLKLLHNYVSFGFAAVLAETAACAKRAGIDAKILIEVLGAGAGEGVVFRRFKPFLESGDTSGLRFAISNALKDLGYYNDMAAAFSAHHNLAEAIEQLYAEATHNGYAARFVPELITMLADGAAEA
jgi:3-hydroxyisobutyrate dehydrogenase